MATYLLIIFFKVSLAGEDGASENGPVILYK